MSSLDNLNKRLNYYGGNAERRLQNDKLRSLKKALLYSYQACTAIMPDGREFRCLINDNKLSNDYDNKILSIPYADICLNTEKKSDKTNLGLERTGIATGQVIEWKETQTHWLVYLEYLEEDAYFRAQIRRCDEEVEIENTKYWIYLRGPVETTIQWNQKHNTSWNDLNYSLIIYITKNEQTLDYFHRFNYLMIDGHKWQVLTADPYSADGIIEVVLGEYYDNSILDEQREEEKNNQDEPDVEEGTIHIVGPLKVKPYDRITYFIDNIENTEGGTWSIDSKKARLMATSTEVAAQIEIMTGRSGEFNLNYILNDNVIASLGVTIESI